MVVNTSCNLIMFVGILICHVMLLKESPDGPPIQEERGEAVKSGHAGLCQ